MNPKVSILIVHRNGEEILKNCLDSIKKTTYPNYDIHILLNNTEDKSEKIIKQYNNIKIYRSKTNLGFTGGFNLMVKKIMNKCKYIASINNDTEVEPNWLLELVKFAEKNNASIVQPKIKAMADRKYFEYAGAAGGMMDKYGYPFCRGRIFSTLEEDTGQYEKPIRLFWACGSCAMFRADLFKKIGVLDEDFFMYAEETDFCWRTNLIGGKIFNVPSSVIYHYGSYSIKKENMSVEKEYLLHRNTLIMFFKNYSDETIKKLRFRRISMEIISGLAFPKKFIPIIKSFVWIIKNKDLIKKKHDRIQKLRKVSDEDIQKLMFNKSIVFTYFLKQKKKFSDLEVNDV
jgi:GT2 family glycosyltransferase